MGARLSEGLDRIFCLGGFQNQGALLLKRCLFFILLAALMGSLIPPLQAFSIPSELEANTQAGKLYRLAGDFFKRQDYAHAAEEYQKLLK